MTEARRRYLEALAISMSCTPDVLDQPGVTVQPDPGRAENHVTAGYLLGEHFVITCDPAVTNTLRVAARDMAPTFEAWEAVAAGLGGELLGRARMQLLISRPRPHPALPAGYELRSLDRNQPAHVSLIEDLINASSVDDLDEAELELDDLGGSIRVVVGPEGDIVSYADSKPFDMAAGFADIGIITRSDQRGRGFGRAAVTSLSQSLLARGDDPLYRCDEDNIGSIRLSEGIGFEPVNRLVAYRFAEADDVA